MPKSDDLAKLQPMDLVAKVDEDLLDLESVEVQYRGRHEAGVIVSDPAQARFTGLGNQRLINLCRREGLGTDRPTKMLVVPNSNRSKLYFIPGVEHKAAVDVTYVRTLPRMNLIKLFTKLKRVLPAGAREFYPIDIAEERVVVDGKEYRALAMPLKKKATRWEKSDAEKEQARQKAEAKRAEKERKAAERKARKSGSASGQA